MRCVTPSEVLSDWAARTGKGGQVLEAEKKGHLRVVDKNGDTKQHDRWSAYIYCLQCIEHICITVLNMYTCIMYV